MINYLSKKSFLPKRFNTICLMIFINYKYHSGYIYSMAVPCSKSLSSLSLKSSNIYVFLIRFASK